MNYQIVMVYSLAGLVAAFLSAKYQTFGQRVACVIQIAVIAVGYGFFVPPSLNGWASVLILVPKVGDIIGVKLGELVDELAIGLDAKRDEEWQHHLSQTRRKRGN